MERVAKVAHQRFWQPAVNPGNFGRQVEVYPLHASPLTAVGCHSRQSAAKLMRGRAKLRVQLRLRPIPLLETGLLHFAGDVGHLGLSEQPIRPEISQVERSFSKN